MKSSVYIVGAACAFLSGITTIGIHSFIQGPANFEESLVMYKTTYYLFTKWWVIFHCLFVIISIYGLAFYLNENRSPFAYLGFTFYVGFGVAEIVRMFLVIHYLSQLRDTYLLATDEQLKQMARMSIDHFAGIGNMLFAAFTVFIILGNIFIGWACLYQKKLIHYLGMAFIFWSAVLIVSLTNEYLNNAFINAFMEYFSLSFQPVLRFAIGVALVKVLMDTARHAEEKKSRVS